MPKVGCHSEDVLSDIVGNVSRKTVCDGRGGRGIAAGTSELNFEGPTVAEMDLPLPLHSTC